MLCFFFLSLELMACLHQGFLMLELPATNLLVHGKRRKKQAEPAPNSLASFHHSRAGN
jgi:hypothetical protein